MFYIFHLEQTAAETYELFVNEDTSENSVEWIDFFIFKTKYTLLFAGI